MVLLLAIDLHIQLSMLVLLSCSMGFFGLTHCELFCFKSTRIPHCYNSVGEEDKLNCCYLCFKKNLTLAINMAIRFQDK